MLFVLLIYGQEPWPAEVRGARLKALRRDLEAANRLGPLLALEARAAHVRGWSGRATVRPGRAAPTAERLRGLWVVDCESLDAGLEIAAQLAREGELVELRPLAELPSTPDSFTPSTRPGGRP